MILNKDILAKNIILLGFSYFMIKIYYTGQISMYVHPRMNIYILLCAIYFVIISIFNIKRIFIKHNANLNKGVLIAFIIPLCIALFVQPVSLSADVIKNKGINISQANSNTSQGNNNLNTDGINNNNNISADSLGNNESTSDDTFGRDSNGNITRTGKDVIRVNENQYYSILCSVFDDIDAYQGKTIEISGYVFRDKTFKDNQFVIGKTLITCCSADATIVGLMCNMRDSDLLKNDEWFTVTGTIKAIIYEGQKMPSIDVGSMKKISKPNNEYVYP